MTLSEKFKKVFESGHSISFQNQVRRSDGEWHSRIIWQHHQLPSNRTIKECEWFGFEEIEECVDDCLKYLESINEEDTAPEMIHKPYVVEFAGVGPKGAFVRLFANQKHKQDDYFKIILGEDTFHYQLKSMSVVDGGYELELIETGYWATTTTKRGVDLNDIMHQTVIPVTDEKEKQDIYIRSCWC